MKYSVYVLGNGQLGRMLKQAGEPLSIDVYPIGLDALNRPHLNENSVITAEIERWPENEVTDYLAQQSSFINRDVFPIIADRLNQKTFLDKLSIVTAPWQSLCTYEQWESIFSELGSSVIVKMRTGGYDGRGQWLITQDNYHELPDEIYHHAIVESKIPFEKEVSLIGARNEKGETVFYPLTHNLHQSGILKVSIAQWNADFLHLQSKAEQMLTSIMNEFNYVGVMAMECFLVGDQLMINELAPRVHNSGHWTQNGASISQFELHLRAILNLPLPKPMTHFYSVMINLIGVEYDSAWLEDSLVKLHWYDKEVRAGRKVGHINLSHSDHQKIVQSLTKLSCNMLKEDKACLNWAVEQLLLRGGERGD